MNLQFIYDVKGNTTGVFIPIEEWLDLKGRFTDLQIEEDNSELTDWQKEILDQRLEDYYKDPSNVYDFDKTISDIKLKI